MARGLASIKQPVCQIMSISGLKKFGFMEVSIVHNDVAWLFTLSCGKQC